MLHKLNQEGWTPSCPALLHRGCFVDNKMSQKTCATILIANLAERSGGRHLLPSAASLRTQRATFAALGSSLY